MSRDEEIRIMDGPIVKQVYMYKVRDRDATREIMEQLYRQVHPPDLIP